MAADPYGPQALVNRLREGGILTDPRVDAAFSAVPRQVFLPGAPLEKVYADLAVPLRHDRSGQAVVAATMPSMIARLLTLAHLREGQNVLHIGTGTGYTAALIAHITGGHGRLTSLELDREIAHNAQDALLRAGYSGVNVVNQDGVSGYAPRAAYDRIVANVGLWDIPTAWITQLKPSGMIAVPIWLDGLQVIGAFKLQPDGTLLADDVKPSAFVYGRGGAAMPSVRKQVGSTALTLIADDLDMLDSVALHTLLSQDYDRSNHLSVSLNTAEYWYGFLPYLTLNEPVRDVFALYTIDINQQAYGMTGEGFAFFTPASACFVPYYGIGATHSFAGADAFLAVEGFLTRWTQAGRPGIDRLRLRLIPRSLGVDVTAPGKVYPRRDHFLHIWMDA
jgi:protein-L-isoaspartate(D-aspartate) O-methyltransferase